MQKLEENWDFLDVSDEREKLNPREKKLGKKNIPKDLG